jgi:hypothetical protein
MINIAIIKGINSGFTKKYRISKVNFSSNGDITSVKNNSKAKSTVIWDYFNFVTLSVPMNQEVIDTYNMINMDIKYAFSKKDEITRKNEIDKIIANENYRQFLFDYMWLIDYASDNGKEYFCYLLDMGESNPKLVK